MRKKLLFRLPSSQTLKLNFSYPDFKKEGIKALFPILDWISGITLIIFLGMVFSAGRLGFVDNSLTGFIAWIYYFVIILFSLQLIRFLIGGVDYYPKTIFDIPVLVFISLVVVSILFNNSDASLVLGGGQSVYLSGTMHFALLLLYYLLVIQTVISKSKSLLFFALGLGFLTFNLSFLGFFTDQLAIQALFIFPLLLMLTLYGKNWLVKIVSGLAVLVGFFTLNFDSFSIAVSMLITLLIVGFSALIFMNEIKIRGKKILNFLKYQWRVIVVLMLYFVAFFISILKTVENYTKVGLFNINESLGDVTSSFITIKEWLFGNGLTTGSGSIYSDMLGSFGLFGLIGFIILLFYVLFYGYRVLLNTSRSGDTDGFSVSIGVLFLYMGLLVFGLFESFGAFLYILLWITIAILGILSTELYYEQKLKLEKVVGFGGNKKLFGVLRIILIFGVVVGSWLLTIWIGRTL